MEGFFVLALLYLNNYLYSFCRRKLIGITPKLHLFIQIKKFIFKKDVVFTFCYILIEKKKKKKDR